MTTIESTTAQLTQQHLGLIAQYTVEAYKSFEKLAENLPNPISAEMFKQFAVDERNNRDLIEMKIATRPDARVRTTLGADLQFHGIHEGNLSFREGAEFLLGRERTMLRRLEEFVKSATDADRALLVFLVAVKRSHMVELERELALLRIDADWWKREDAQNLIVHGVPML